VDDSDLPVGKLRNAAEDRVGLPDLHSVGAKRRQNGFGLGLNNH